jgi:hypothetical protein
MNVLADEHRRRPARQLDAARSPAIAADGRAIVAGRGPFEPPNRYGISFVSMSSE